MDYWFTDRDEDFVAALEKVAAHPGTVGIPDPWRFGDPGKRLKPQTLVPYVVQRHLAEKAGPHYDIRLGKDRMFSFATRKELPEPGKRIAVHQTPLHAESYKHFKGSIPLGYGKGTVHQHDLGEVLILDAKPDKIKFVVAHKRFPEEFTLIRMKGKPKATGSIRKPRKSGATWLMLNTTPNVPVAHKKVTYRKIPAEKIDKLFDPEYVLSEKIDGAAAFVRLLKDKIHVMSYRASKATGGPIVHTYRMGLGGKKLDIPKTLVGKTLRGEIWGERGGKAIPPQELGGILNSALAKSLRTQTAKNVKLRMALFGVKGEQLTHEQTQKVLDEALKSLPQDIFHKPLHAFSHDEKRRMIRDIQKGRNPRTREGVVAAPLAGGRPAKFKEPSMAERDVWIREIMPGSGRLEGKGAGGFKYSLSPDGPPVGEVGSGLSEDLRHELWSDPKAYLGRMARVRSQGAFPSGALRAPSLIALHEDYPLAKAAESDTIIPEMDLKKLALWNMPARGPVPGTETPKYLKERGAPWGLYGKVSPLLNQPWRGGMGALPTTHLSRQVRGGVAGPGAYVAQYTGNKWLGMLADVAAMRSPEQVAGAIEYIQWDPNIRAEIEKSIPKNVKGPRRQDALRKAYIQRMLPALLMPLLPSAYMNPGAAGRR